MLAGVIVAGAALGLATLVLPFAKRWAAREATYAASSAQWARLAGLAAGTGVLRAARDDRRRTQGAEQARLIDGATPALAASTVQALLQRYAEESSVQLDRVDVAGQPRAEVAGLLAIPVLLQGQGDVYGLVEFLDRVQAGGALLVIDELTINAAAGPADDRQTLVWMARLHGLYRAPDAAGGRPS